MDEALRDELEKHLAALRREGIIEAWHDRRITAGRELDPEIDKHLLTADVILLLFSADFIASQYCYEREAQTALKRHEAGEARVIPVILRPCDWQSTPFKKLLAAPRDGKPVTRWPDRDEAFLDVVRMVRAAIADIGRNQSRGPKPQGRVAPPVLGPRSSNLSLPRAFTDRDKDKFLAETFTYIAQFFENSLHELEQRNDGIEVEFQKVDARSFEASAYAGGSLKTRCGVWWGDRMLGRGILYSSSGVSHNSFNESISVESDGGALFLKPLGMPHLMGGVSERLSEHGAAEYLWSIFIERLRL